MLHKLIIVPVIALASFAVAAADVIPVSVQQLGDLLIDREVRAPATVVSANRAIVTSEVSALVREVTADVGAAVRKGDLLIRLDDDNARLALAQARASLAALDAQIVQARQRLRKAEELLEKNFVSDDELIARQTDLAVLEANRTAQLVSIQQAELTLSRTRIKAPFDATVVERQAQVGSFAMPGSSLITIVQTDSREIDAEIDPQYADGLPAATDLYFASQGRNWPVTIARLSDVIETSTRKVRGRFVFTADAAPVGASGELVWRDAQGLVPVTVIVQRGTEFGVFIAEDQHARFVAIPGAQEGRPAAVQLPRDTLVVSRGHMLLQDGDALKIVGR
ncbi:MAG TPA: efflux RND transporter periplasmic adaptor subunit [Woeseiaceae bacterium]|nr:efflux RND transporter periplasmic adaptor subunit [Woeseiaceae bacterium]